MRYKQTLIGLAWALLQPFFVLMAFLAARVLAALGPYPLAETHRHDR